MRILRSRRAGALIAGLAAVLVIPLSAGPAAAADPVSSRPPVAVVGTLSGQGYWIAAADGGVFTFGDARFYGSDGGTRLNQPVVDIARTPSGNGYWLTAADGGVFNYGDAGFYGSAGSIRLNQPIVDIAGTPTGRGYWLTAKDGGIFAYGDAGFYGSAGSIQLNAPVVSMAPTPSGHGYWLGAADGGVFAYGDAPFYGSAGSIRLNAPVVEFAASPSGRGYWLFAADGGVFAYGDAPFAGSLGSQPLAAPIVAGTTSATGGYWLMGGDGGIFALGTRYWGRVKYGSGGYALVLPRASVNATMLTARHHDHPAVDLPVPVGTSVFAITAGTASRLDTDPAGCGWGMSLRGDDGGSYLYCHLSQREAINGRVSAGALLGRSGGAKGAAGAGSSTGPHLHVQVRVSGTLRCPQSLLLAIYEGRPTPAVGSLPTSGCTY